MDNPTHVVENRDDCAVSSRSDGIDSPPRQDAEGGSSYSAPQPIALRHNSKATICPRPLLASLRRVYSAGPLPAPRLANPTTGSMDAAARPLSQITQASAVPEIKRVDAATHTSTTPNPRDRRAHPRRESGCQVAVCPRSAQCNLTPQHIEWALHAAELKGRLVDVSMSGLAMELAEPIEAQTQVYMRISNRNLDRKIDTCGRILRCVENEAGQWNLVCRLEKNLSFEQLHYLGKHLFASTIV